MTNNPTIDGVSRATIEAILKDGSCKPEVNDTYRAARKELRALLDAPAVERQEMPFPGYPPVPDDRKISPPEVDALQSTIAQLQARIEELESGGEPVGTLKRVGQVVVFDAIGDPHIRDGMEVFTAPPAPVALAMSFEFEHPSSKEKRTVTLTKRDVLDGMEDYFYDKIGEQICQCESVGETNVIDCNCDEYAHDFEIVNACLDATAALNGPTK